MTSSLHSEAPPECLQLRFSIDATQLWHTSALMHVALISTQYSLCSRPQQQQSVRRP